MSLAAARLISSAVNPVLVGCWLIVVFSAWRRRETRVWEFAGASATAVALTYLGVHGFRAAKLWPGHPWFPSGHETFAVSVVTSLMTRDRRWAALTPLLALLGFGLVRAGYHDRLDMGGAALMTPPIVAAWHLLVRRWNSRRRASPN